jgi:hypothetical protein
MQLFPHQVELEGEQSVASTPASEKMYTNLGTPPEASNRKNMKSWGLNACILHTSL